MKFIFIMNSPRDRFSRKVPAIPMIFIIVKEPYQKNANRLDRFIEFPHFMG